MGMIKPKYDIHNNEDGTFKVTATATFGGFKPAEITLTADQFQRFDSWRKGDKRAMIQDALPELSKDQREILLSGIGPEEWSRLA